jgi:twitching motility protein PilT
MELKSLLEEMVSKKASDLHLKVGIPPSLRLDGQLVRTERAAPSSEDMEKITSEVLSARQKRELEETNDVDFSFGLSGLGRFRVNFCRQRGTLAATIRIIPFQIPELESLNLSPMLEDLALHPRGLILVTGTVGSGKSTTLASMIGLINRKRGAKIVTVEDPIEFLFLDEQCQIVQREVGTDTRDFASALRHALRQDPDVIMVGEIRDTETMSIALTAANTGHLVLSTLHTVDAAQTVNRVISFFPPYQAEEIRFLLSSCLLAVNGQRLVARADGNGRIPASELLVATAAVREYLLDPEKVPLIADLIADGSQYGMHTFDQSLLRLCQEGLITSEVALQHATRPSDFQLSLDGVQGSKGFDWSDLTAKGVRPGGGGGA